MGTKSFGLVEKKLYCPMSSLLRTRWIKSEQDHCFKEISGTITSYALLGQLPLYWAAICFNRTEESGKSIGGSVCLVIIFTAVETRYLYAHKKFFFFFSDEPCSRVSFSDLVCQMSEQDFYSKSLAVLQKITFISQYIQYTSLVFGRMT